MRMHISVLRSCCHGGGGERGVVSAHQHMLHNLSRILTIMANDHKSLDSPAKVNLDHCMAPEYILAEQRGICVIVNSSCWVHINVSSEVETSIKKIRRQATWLQ